MGGFFQEIFWEYAHFIKELSLTKRPVSGSKILIFVKNPVKKSGVFAEICD
jgi:hypothetical protein